MNPSDQTEETGESGNNRKRILEGSVNNVPLKRFKVMSTEDPFKIVITRRNGRICKSPLPNVRPKKEVHDSILMENPIP